MCGGGTMSSLVNGAAPAPFSILLNPGGKQSRGEESAEEHQWP